MEPTPERSPTRHATLYFEDDPETGMIEFRCDFFGPIDPRSHSHNIACQTISWLNERAKEVKNPTLVNTQDDGVHL